MALNPATACENAKECSRATARLNPAATVGRQEVAKRTVPRCWTLSEGCCTASRNQSVRTRVIVLYPDDEKLPNSGHGSGCRSVGLSRHAAASANCPPSGRTRNDARRVAAGRHRQGRCRQRAAPVHQGGHRLHDGHDQPPCPSHPDGALGADARRQSRGPDPLQPHHQCADRRDQSHVAVAAEPPTAGARALPPRHEDDDERGRARHADAGHADRRAVAAARSGPRRRLRPALSHRHDPASPGRREHGQGAIRQLRRRRRRPVFQIRLRRPNRSDHRDRADGEDVADRSDHAPIEDSFMRSLQHTLALTVLTAAACGHPATTGGGAATPAPATNMPAANMSTSPPSPDPRIGLKAGLMNAQEAVWNLRVLSKTPPSGKFLGSTNSDLAFTGHYVIQGNYNGYQVWDISNPRAPSLVVGNYCPASQSDVSVYKNLLFVSAEGNSGRIDCGDQAVRDTVSRERIRGIRIFDITDITHPKNITNVQTCRGSHTHSLLVDPKDPANVYVYVSGSASIRSPSELSGCVASADDPNTARFRIEAIT